MLITLPSGATAEIRPLDGLPRWARGGKYRRRRQRENGGGEGWSKAEFQSLCESYGNKCLACGCGGPLVADHVTPLKRGGKHHLSNIQPLCWKCNTRKGLQIIDYR